MGSGACACGIKTVSDPNVPPPNTQRRGRWVKGQGSPNPGGRKKAVTQPQPAPQPHQAPQAEPQVGSNPQPHAEVEQPSNT
jgi:hypothetical protein